MPHMWLWNNNVFMSVLEWVKFRGREYFRRGGQGQWSCGVVFASASEVMIFVTLGVV